MSPIIRRSSSLSSTGSGSQSNGGGNNNNNNGSHGGGGGGGGAGRISIRDARNSYNTKYHAISDDGSPPTSANSSPAKIITITTGRVLRNAAAAATPLASGDAGDAPARTVTPTGGLAAVSPSSSWEDYEEGFYNFSSSSPRKGGNNRSNTSNTSTSSATNAWAHSKAPRSPARSVSASAAAPAFRQRPAFLGRAFGVGGGGRGGGGTPAWSAPSSPSGSSLHGRNGTAMSTSNHRTSSSMRSERTPYLDDTTLGSSRDDEDEDNNRTNIGIGNAPDDDDMPMDERMDIRKNDGRQFYHHRRTASNQSGSTAHSLHLRRNKSLPLDDSCSATYRSMTPTKEVNDIVAMSPNGDRSVTGGHTGMARMIAALNNGSTSRPPKLNREECILWDSLQTAMVNDRNEHVAKRRDLERSLQESNLLLCQVASKETDLQSSLNEAQLELADVRQQYDELLSKNHASKAQQLYHEDGDHRSTSNGVEGDDTAAGFIQDKVESLEKKLQDQDSLMKQQQAEHHAEVRAIQRVLADVSTEKAQLEERLEKQLQAAAADSRKPKINEDSQFETPDKDKSCSSDDGLQATGSLASLADDSNGNLSHSIEKLKEALRLAEQEKQAAKREAEKKARRLLVLERDIKANKMLLNTVSEEKDTLANEAACAKSDADGLRSEMEILNAQMKDIEKEFVAQKKRNELLLAEIRALKKARDDAIKEAEVATSAANAAKEAAKAAKDAVMIATLDEMPKLHKTRGGMARSDGDEKEDVPPVMSEERIEMLQRNLADTAASLENAKKIIASLENANGALALDLRAKLKAKEEDLSISQKEADERKRRLDSLATELRDLQRKQGDVENADKRTKAQLVKQKALMGHLESSLSDLQSAVAVHEASTEASGTADTSSMDEISEILGDTLYAVKVTLEATEQYVDDVDDTSVAKSDTELNSEIGRHVDAIVRTDREATAQDIRNELEQKRVAVKRLEEALKKQNDEMRKLRSVFEARGRGNGGDGNEQLRAEIQNLRQQCSTNMEVLAKKERELSVLRSSLKVDDDDAGYISDDGSDDEDNEEEGETSLSPAKLNDYGPAEAEALATILSQTSGGIDMPGRARELESLKNELMKATGDRENAAKELQSERESLANAKMIISSLEKANKGMMEDLRSRLQDSNTAIASLLDKSMEHEKNADLLKEEIEKLKQQRLEEQEKHVAEVERLKERIKSSAGRSDCDLTGIIGEVTPDETPSEEKKEDGDGCP